MKPNSSLRKIHFKGLNCVKTTGCQMELSMLIGNVMPDQNVFQRMCTMAGTWCCHWRWNLDANDLYEDF